MSESSALLLSNSSWVRYKPDFLNGESVDFTFHAWDGSTDSASTALTQVYANPGAGGGSTAYSDTAAQASLVVSDVDDVPVITGDTSGSVSEDDAATLTVSGDLDATGGDTGEDLFNAETLTGSYGDLTVTSAGGWTYSADNSQAGIQALALSDTLTEIFTVTNADGATTQTVTITIAGVDDVPVITGDISGSVSEDDAATLTVSGDLDATGGDTGEDEFNAETLSGTYGDVSILADGSWTYTADNSQASIQALGAGESLTETFTVTNADDVTTATVTITIDGVNDAPTVVAINLGNINEDNSRLITQADLLAGSSDTEGDTLTAINLTLSSGSGTLTDNRDGTWTFDPTADWSWRCRLHVRRR